ncbi:hypothetical protein GC176_04630 [bacterium]|nr:hypothetical protein [bacterium]
MALLIQKHEADQVAEIMKMLDRWDARFNGHQNQKRENQRSLFRSQILVTLAELAELANVPHDQTHLRVWARNLSPSGVGFLHRGKIDSRKIVVCLDPDSGAQHSYSAIIIRSRKLQNDFYEYGAVFLHRIEH